MNQVIIDVLSLVYGCEQHVQSNRVRNLAYEFATLASLGYITTVTEHGEFGEYWQITQTGLEFLAHERDMSDKYAIPTV